MAQQTKEGKEKFTSGIKLHLYCSYMALCKESLPLIYYV